MYTTAPCLSPRVRYHCSKQADDLALTADPCHRIADGSNWQIDLSSIYPFDLGVNPRPSPRPSRIAVSTVWLSPVIAAGLILSLRKLSVTAATLRYGVSCQPFSVHSLGEVSVELESTSEV